jgi:hypothetical protein
MNNGDANMNKLERIAAFVREHGFFARIVEGAVIIRIEYTSPKGDGYTEETARTIGEARTILGY